MEGKCSGGGEARTESAFSNGPEEETANYRNEGGRGRLRAVGPLIKRLSPWGKNKPRG